MAKHELATYFLLEGKIVAKVCTKKQRPGTICLAAHEVPEGAIWSGHWYEDEAGDLRADISESRKKFRKTHRGWLTKRRKLMAINPAPAFRAYHQSMIDAHMREKPKFTYKPYRTP